MTAAVESEPICVVYGIGGRPLKAWRTMGIAPVFNIAALLGCIVPWGPPIKNRTTVDFVRNWSAVRAGLPVP